MKLLSKIREAKKRLSGFWAIEKNSYLDIIKIYSSFEKNPKAFIQDISPNAIGDLFSVNPEEILIINEDETEATITIRGPLVDAHDCSTVFFGCTSYEHIIESIKTIESMESIKKVVFDIDSPGGMVAGVDNAAIAINTMTKETEARVGIMAASAAYWLASQCDSITATSATASFGSIGVVVEYWDNTRKLTEEGFDKVSITSTGAPDKRVDALTEEGRRKIKSDLDEIESVFFRRVAEGRGVTPSDVAGKFGQGGMFLAEKSLKAGMIDKTDFVFNNNINSNKPNKETAESQMNLKEYLSKYPEGQKEINALVKVEADKAVVISVASSEESKKASAEIVDKAAKYLGSSYPDKVKNLAIEVIKGEKSFESLEVGVSMFDANEESNNSEAAQDESEIQGETPSEVTEDVSEDGKVKDEASYQAALARIKN